MSAFPMCQVEEQLIWEDGAVKDGVVQITGGPDIRVKNPVVMSNASRFVAQAVPGSRQDIFYKNCLPGTVEIYVFDATPPFFVGEIRSSEFDLFPELAVVSVGPKSSTNHVILGLQGLRGATL